MTARGMSGGGAVLPGARHAHRGAARRRVRGLDVRRAAEPGAVPRVSRRLPRGRQQCGRRPINSRTATKLRPSSSRRSAFVPSRGRLLEPTDRRGAAGVAVVNQTYARAYLDGADPIGRRIRLPGGGSWRAGASRVGSARRAHRQRGRDRRRDPGHQAGQPSGSRAARRLHAAGAVDDAQDGDHRPRGERRSRRADPGDSPRARGDGPHDPRRVCRLLGRHRRVAGAAAARHCSSSSCSASCR